jgi:hypothetical protein
MTARYPTYRPATDKITACPSRDRPASGGGRVAEAAAPYDADAKRVLAELHDGNFLRLDAAGQVRAAYPFSAAATAHLAQITGGPPRVFARARSTRWASLRCAAEEPGGAVSEPGLFESDNDPAEGVLLRGHCPVSGERLTVDRFQDTR